MSSSKIQYDPKVTGILVDLRNGVNPKITQSNAARYFDLKQRQTVAKWEAGTRRPPEKTYRQAFQIYLLDLLNLRRNIKKFHHVWNVLMVQQWEWEPLTPKELRNILPGTASQYIISTPPPVLTLPSLPSYRLTGRDAIIEDLRQSLMEGRIVALYGLPGVGKTALAIQLANDARLLTHFFDGVLWAGIGPSGDILSELTKWGSALEIPLQDIKDPQDPKCWAEEIGRRIQNRRFLLVIDDVWDIETAEYLRLDGPRCGLIVTTRFPRIAYHFAQGAEIHIPELDIHEGLQILRRSAPIVVEKNPEGTEQLVKAVSGLPLALNLMGKYLGMQSHSQSSRLIDQALVRLASAMERLQINDKYPIKDHHPSLPIDTPLSLDAMISISYEQLQPVSRRMLNALTVLPAKPNTFSEEAATTIADEDVEALDELYDYGLVENASVDRYTIHQTIAEYAQLQLEDESAGARASEFFANYVVDHQTDFVLLDFDSQNITTALAIADNQNLYESFVRGSNAFYPYLESRGAYKQALLLLERTVTVATTSKNQTQLAKALHNSGKVTKNIANYSEAREYLNRALTLAKTLSDVQQVSAILQTLGSVDIEQGNYKSAETNLKAGLALVRSTESIKHNHELKAKLIQDLGLTYMHLGDYEQGESYYQEGLALSRRHNLKDRISSILNNLTSMFGSRGHFGEAEIYAREGLKLAEELGHRENICTMYQNLGGIAAYKGDLSQAYTLYKQALAIAEEIGSFRRICTMKMALGAIEYRLGHYDLAKEFLKNASNEARRINNDEVLSFALETLGSVASKRNNYQLAMEHYNEAFQAAERIQNRERILALMVSLGRTVGRAQGDYLKAETYLNDALVVAKELDHARHHNNILNAQGQIYFEQNKLVQAERSFSQALKLGEAKQFPDLVGDSYFGIAQIQALQGNTKEAEKFGQKSYDIFASRKYHQANEVKRWLENLHTH